MYNSHGSSGIPFAERGGRLRGLIDLATGRYPAFLFGGPLGSLVPVFHLHEVTQAWIEPRLRYLADNGYRTATADEIAHYVTGRGPLGPRRVALTFDDARASLWTVAAPLLRKYGLTAIAFAIPARITDAAAVRPTIADGVDRAEAADDSDTPFVTWPEVQALQASGIIDVQAHTFSHAAIFCSDRTVGFVTPDYARETILDRPLISGGGTTQVPRAGRAGRAAVCPALTDVGRATFPCASGGGVRCSRSRRRSWRGCVLRPTGVAFGSRACASAAAGGIRNRGCAENRDRRGTRPMPVRPPREAWDQRGPAHRSTVGNCRRGGASRTPANRIRDSLSRRDVRPSGCPARRRSVSHHAAERKVPSVPSGPRTPVLHRPGLTPTASA